MKQCCAFLAVLCASVLCAQFGSAAGVAPRTGHPRLIVVEADLPAVRERINAAGASNLVARIKSLSEYDWFQSREGLKEVGYQAAGYGVLHVLTGDEEAATTARNRLQKRVLGFPMEGTLTLLERSCRVLGGAMAYDLCWRSWKEADRDAIGKGVESRGRRIFEEVQRKGDGDPNDALSVIGYCAAGMAALAVLGDPCCSNDTGTVLETCTQRVSDYLLKGMTTNGVSFQGEGPKQVALMTGILPFCRAYKNTFGMLPAGGERIEIALLATALQTVPGSGSLRFGNAGTTVDRSGLFSVGVGLAAEGGLAQSALIWLYQQTVAEGEYDIVRPVHGLYGLSSDILSWRSKKPKLDALPLTMADRGSGFHCFRSSWSGTNDMVAAIHLHGANGEQRNNQNGGEFHILGMNGRWATALGGGPNQATRMANVFGVSGGDESEARCACEVLSLRSEGKGIYSMAIARTGTVQAASVKKAGARNTGANPGPGIPSATPFKVLRYFGADYSGVCGVPGLFVVVDRIEVGADAPTLWTMHTETPIVPINKALEAIELEQKAELTKFDKEAKDTGIDAKDYAAKYKAIELKFLKRVGVVRGYLYWEHDMNSLRFSKRRAVDSGFTLDSFCDLGMPDVSSMRVSWFTEPEKVVMKPLFNPPQWNLLTIEDATFLFVVMTLQPGEAPAVRFDKDGGNVRAVVGKREVKFDGTRLAFSER
jgi:hypothetical protein